MANVWLCGEESYSIVNCLIGEMKHLKSSWPKIGCMHMSTAAAAGGCNVENVALYHQ